MFLVSLVLLIYMWVKKQKSKYTIIYLYIILICSFVLTVLFLEQKENMYTLKAMKHMSL